MEPITKLPGVTFFVDRSSLTGRVGRVVLNAEVNNPDLWSKVVAILENFRVYTIENLQVAVVRTLQEENQEERERAARDKAHYTAENERLLQRVSILEHALRSSGREVVG